MKKVNNKFAVLASLIAAVLVFALCEVVIKTSGNVGRDEYDKLYAVAREFDEIYEEGSSKDAMKLADDYTKDGEVSRVLFENSKCYIILEYDQDKNLIDIDERAKGMNAVDKTLVSFLIALVTFSVIYCILIMFSDHHKINEDNE